MHSYLFVSSDLQKIRQEAQKYSNNNKARLLEYENATIDQVRELKRFVTLTVNEKLAIFLPSINLSSEAAQNALLKTLEEPQEHVTFILGVENEEQVLPTIRSRCEVVRFPLVPSAATLERFDHFIQMTKGEKLKKISEITKREEAISFLKEILEAGSIRLSQNPEFLPLVESAFTTLKRIEANGNVQLQLANFVSQYLSHNAN